MGAKNAAQSFVQDIPRKKGHVRDWLHT